MAIALTSLGNVMHHVSKNNQSKDGKAEGGLLTESEKNILKKVQMLAHNYDKKFNFCGKRFGWSAVLALVIPEVGDLIDVILTSCLISTAKQANLSSRDITKMVVCMVVSASCGLMPIVGGLFVGWFGANTRIAKILEDALKRHAQERNQVGQQPKRGVGCFGICTM